MARKILLADDSVTAQNMGRKILSDAGYEVIAVNNGSAALKKIAEIRPDLVVLDVYMPGYSGLEVCQRLKESPETARTPVLLTVGKLEPFKPEEAQRVRAEAFIVKPFEASELLSALSKLEDKVVPRPEPWKPGRFARTIAAVEASEQDRRGDGNDSNGWKKRISFPQTRPAEDKKPADDPAIYNPVNRDLRTIVETPSERSAGRRREDQPAQDAPQSSVDVSALAPEGLPKDVTAEEVAAIAAAAAQIQAAEANNRSDQTSALSSAPTPIPEVQATAMVPSTPSAEPEIGQAPGIQAENQVATAEPVHSNEAESSRDEPVTMAAAPESLPAASSASWRWTAVPVALDAEEAAVSLEDEMRKANAAFAVADAFSALSQAPPEVQDVPAESSQPHEAKDLHAVPAVDSSIAPATIELHKAETTSAAAACQSDTEPTASEAAAPTPGPDSATEATSATLVDSVAHDTTTSAPDAVSPDTAAPTEPESPFVSFVKADSTCFAETKAESQPPAEDGHESARAAVASSESSSLTGSPTAREETPIDHAVHSGTDTSLDPETRSAAAAWANWRQIREVQKEPEAGTVQAQDAATQPGETQPSTDSAFRAVAAGAERIAQEPGAEAKDVASIVESVLADLRPKLMEEISRKMAQRK